MKLLEPLLLLLLWITQSSQKIPVYIGGFFPLSPNKASVPGQALLAAAELALDHVNKSDVLQDYELNMIVKDSKVCSEAMLSRVQKRDPGARCFNKLIVNNQTRTANQSDFRRAKNSYTTAPKNYNPHWKRWQKAVSKNNEGR